jgi:hypothetical protein
MARNTADITANTAITIIRKQKVNYIPKGEQDE